MKSLMLILSLFAAMLTTFGSGQHVQPNYRPSTKMPVPVDCSTLGDAPGCKSFNEMLAAGDKDILNSTSGRQDSLICFRENDDLFLILSFSRPDHFLPQKETGFVHSFAWVAYERYKGGQYEDALFWDGSWIKWKDTGNDYGALEVKGEPGSTLYIDSSEASVSYAFLNLGKTTTHYSFRIRRSTLRFTETFDWLETRKANAATQHLEYSGHCAEYGKTSPGISDSGTAATMR